MSLLSFYQDKKAAGTLNSFDEQTLERLEKEEKVLSIKKRNFKKAEQAEKEFDEILNTKGDDEELVAIGGLTKGAIRKSISSKKSSFNWSNFDAENDTGIM